MSASLVIALVLAINSPLASLDPYSLAGLDAYQVTGLIVEPLARAHPTTKELIPWLAEGWTVNARERSFRARLRSGIRFHDGRPLTADDVKFTFDSYYDAEYKAAEWRGMWNEIERVEVIDPRTVEFKAKGSLHYLAFENVLTALRILPRSFYSPANAAKFRINMVGTGPFRVSRFEDGRNLELAPFPEWWGSPKPNFRLKIKTVQDPLLAGQMAAKGELDFFALPSSVRFRAGEAKKIRVLASRSGMGEGLWIDLNLKRDIFKDKNVRRALVKMWDRSSMNTKLYDGRFELALDTFARKMSYYPEGKAEKFEPRKARELLAAAGWRDRDKNSVLEKTVNGQTREFEFTVLVRSAETERWVSLFQADAAQCGVKVNIVRHDESAQWLKLLREGKFDAVAGEGGASESVHAVSWRTGGAYNFSGYSSSETDRLLKVLESEFDPAKRRAIDKRLIAKLREDIVQLPGLYSPDERFLLSARLEVDPVHPRQAWRWRTKP